MTVKEDVRRLCIDYRFSVPPPERTVRQKTILFKIMQFVLEGEFHSVGLFYPVKGEPDLRLLVPIFREEGVEISFPVVAGEKLLWSVFNGWERGKFNKWNIWEPEGPETLSELIIVPGVAFDLMGNRIGYGGGFFDRFLKDFSGTSVGVVFHRCLFTLLPADEHDVRVNFVISESVVVGEKGWLRYRKEVGNVSDLSD